MQKDELYDFRFFLKEGAIGFGKQIDLILTPLKQKKLSYEILNPDDSVCTLRFDNDYISFKQGLGLLVEAKKQSWDMTAYYDGAILVVTTIDSDLDSFNCLNREFDVEILRYLVDLNIGFGYTVQI